MTMGEDVNPEPTDGTSDHAVVVGRYLRSVSGEVIHLDPCRRAGKAVVWHYAEGLSLHEVAASVNGVEWLRLCKVCWPADAHSYRAPTEVSA